jgi:hypothetical protein
VHLSLVVLSLAVDIKRIAARSGATKQTVSVRVSTTLFQWSINELQCRMATRFGSYQMSDQVRIALIGAAQAIIVAVIGMLTGVVVAILNRKREERNFDSRRGAGMNKKRSFAQTRMFVWCIAPLTGAVLALATLGGWRVLAGSQTTKAPFCMHGYFFPSGFMNDPKQIEVVDSWSGNCHSGPTCVKITYTPGDKTWAGMYWQFPDGNWGEKPGRKIEGAKKLVFWARGQNGGETLDFKSGGISQAEKKYQDSFERILETKTLSTDWQPFEIDLAGTDTSSVLGAFAWTASKSANRKRITFYLDGICFQ